MSAIGRPQSKQSSRKGRKAWRKNVDIADIETSLAEKYEEEVTHGKAINEAGDEDLFFIDEEAEANAEEKLKKYNIKKLKASEILENKSKVNAIINERAGRVGKPKDKVQGVSKKEMVQLLKLAGKVKGYDKNKERMDKEGIIKSKAYDVWSVPTDVEKKFEELPQVLKEQSGISFMPPSVKPKTMKEAPIKVKNMEIIPHAGKSYNPSYDNWRNLIEQEFFKEKTLDDQRVALQEFQDRLQYIMEHEHHDEENDDSEDDEEEEKEEEEEVENQQEGEDKYRLSINPVTETKIKTKTQRNKEKRHSERVNLENDIKALKLHIKELEKLPNYIDEVNVEELERNSKPSETKGERALRRGTKKLGKFNVVEGPIEVKLSSELSDSLRKLKPEGNLLYDQMKRMQSKGLIETRRMRNKKKSKKKITEKWTYKDFK
ncbi:Nop53 protein [Martiniozyma asiatica (nom. inval.)]|nr:Nop53 protein [Martiniozyma asiatica]